MTPEQIQLVQSSWEKVKPISEKAAELFYGKLFELNPDFKELFTNDMDEQGRKLMAMINTAVNSLNNLEAVVPAVEEMGKRHVGYGVKDEDYDVVGEALLWTLGAGLGDDFTDDVKDAWTETYVVLSTTMKNAAATIAA
ncbi:MAG: globin family protein [Thioalkalispiraceae bacterium]|jgi:hemoglobin-like flavoprotein